MRTNKMRKMTSFKMPRQLVAKTMMPQICVRRCQIIRQMPVFRIKMPLFADATFSTCTWNYYTICLPYTCPKLRYKHADFCELAWISLQNLPEIFGVENMPVFQSNMPEFSTNMPDFWTNMLEKVPTCLFFYFLDIYPPIQSIGMKFCTWYRMW
jgi:hypothetical protein